MTSRIWVALRWLLYLAAAGVIVLAMLVGLVRLLLPLAPQYQDGIRAWASTATGYEIGFVRISASWPLAGPQLTFYDVSLTRPGEVEPLLEARQLSAGISLLGLLRDARLSLSHVAVRGSKVRVQKDTLGQWSFQDRRLSDLLPRPSTRETPRLRVDLDEIVVTFMDLGRGQGPVAFDVETLTARLGDSGLAIQARLKPPAELGRQVDVELRTVLPLPADVALPGTFELRIVGDEIDLPRAWSFGTGEPAPLAAAIGNVTLQASFQDAKARSLHAVLGLRQVQIGEGPGSLLYQRLAGRLAWSRVAGGWRAVLSDLRVRREGRDSPVADVALSQSDDAETGSERWAANAAFLRLDDLFPIVRALLSGTELESQLPEVLDGDLRGLDVEMLSQEGQSHSYRLRAGFERLSVTDASGAIAVKGLSGTATANADGGRLQLDSRDVSVGLTQWFRDTLEADSVRGLFVWRVGSSGIHLLSDDIDVQAAAIRIGSRLQLHLPGGGASPMIDLKAAVSASEAREVLRYLPLRRFPAPVVDWLERAIVAGRVPQATVEFAGALNDFPYEQGEGVFRVELGLQDGVLDYAEGWPRIEALSATVVFDGVSMYSTSNRARIANLSVSDYAVRIDDLRQGLLSLQGRQQVGLNAVFDFLRATPGARALGETLARVTAAGPVAADLRLALPIPHPDDYRLEVLFDARGCQLGLQGLPVDLTDMRGRVRLQNTRLSATGVTALMLGEPVTVELRPQALASSFSHLAEFSGRTPVARVMATFNLPLRERFDGSLDWQAQVRVPALRVTDAAPLSVLLRSDLLGVTSSLPAPLTKAADVAWPTNLELRFPADAVIDVEGRMQPPLSWALRMVAADGLWRVERGSVVFGRGEARLAEEPGVEVAGRLAELRLGDWLALGDGGDGREFQRTYRQAALQVERLVIAGQMFREVEANAKRGADSWSIAVRAPAAEGEITVPFDLASRALRLDMKRLWLLESGDDDQKRTDPRDVPAVELRSADTMLGRRGLGSLEMSVEKVPDGLVAPRIVAQGRNFRLDADGDWSVAGGDADRQSTRLKLTLQSQKVADMLEQLGFDPVLSGTQGRVSADLRWSGAPSADFLTQARGRIGLEFRDGQVLDIEPGSGRILGLLSVTALPRRLALDFRDVFNEGLGFDVIQGEFRVGSGSAYTCNLGLSGPAIDIGIIGRTGFAQEDYDQLAVVRPQVSNVLAVGGAVLGGPVGGVTMLLISQIFRKPLSTLGESYYRVSGGWDKPEVVRVQRSDVDAAAFKDCEREVTTALQAAESLAPAGINGNQAPGEPR